MSVIWHLMIWISSNMENTLTKKRILFQKDRDTCFLAYNILIILDYLKCYSLETSFKDYRKLSYLVDFTSSDILIGIFCKTGTFKQKEFNLLKNSYINASSRQNQIFLLIQVLRQKEIVDLDLDTDDPLKNRLFIKNKEIIEPIIDKKKFYYEYRNIDLFNKSPEIRALRSLLLATLLDKIYSSRGIKVWEG